MANGYDIDLTLFIDGERIGAAGRATHRVVNPATGHRRAAAGHAQGFGPRPGNRGARLSAVRWAKTPEAAEKMSRNEAVGSDEYYMRVSPKFDAPDGAHAWMNKHVFVGVAEKIPGANRIHYFVVR